MRTIIISMYDIPNSQLIKTDLALSGRSSQHLRLQRPHREQALGSLDSPNSFGKLACSTAFQMLETALTITLQKANSTSDRISVIWKHQCGDDLVTS